MSSTWDEKDLKATPLVLDEILLIDTADSRNQKRVALSNFALLGVNNANGSLTLGTGNIFFGTGGDIFIRRPAAGILQLVTDSIERLTVRSEGVVIGDSGTSTTRTGSFLHLATSAGIPTGTPDIIVGVQPLVYDTVDNNIFVFNDSIWNQVSNHTFAREVKLVDENVTNTTLQDDDKLSIPLRANKVYSGILSLFFVSPVAASFKYEFSVPTGATGLTTSTGSLSSVTPVVAGSITSLQAGLTTSGSNEALVIKFTVIMSSTPGNITFRWAQNSESGTTTVFAGSDMVIWEGRA